MIFIPYLHVLKKLFHLLLLLFFFLLIIYADLVLYGLQQLKGQMNIIIHAKEVKGLLADSSFDKKYREKLLLIQQVRKFSVDSLGLKDSENYTSFYDQQGKPALWVLTACEPFALNPYTWKFPVVGKVSYKGFFKKEIGEKEEQQLLTKNFDTNLSPVTAWSTLGWFRDPILSGMIDRRNDGEIAELIIHELTHATVYVKNNVEYNENLATFIGEQGAMRFMNSCFANDLQKIIEYDNALHDGRLYSEAIVQSAKELDSLYKTFNSKIDSSVKKLLKEKMIDKIISGLKNIPLKNPDRYLKKFDPDKSGRFVPNNTYFMSYLRYHNMQPLFEYRLKYYFNGDLKKFISSIDENNPL